MNRTHGCFLATAAVIGTLALPCYPADEPTPAPPRTRRNDRGRQILPAGAEILTVAGKVGFLAMPASARPGRKTPWLWYFPTDYNLPGKYEKWMFAKCLANGIAVAGLDLDVPLGNPRSRGYLTAFHKHLTLRRNLTRQACLIGRSRGGLQMVNWASEHPEFVAGIAGIYPVCDLASWPGLKQACKAYGMSEEQLAKQLPAHNPIARLKPLATAGVPIYIVHGDKDTMVPLDRNSGLLAERYKALGGPITLDIKKGQGHNYWRGFFEDKGMAAFIVKQAKKTAALPSVLIFGDSICGGYGDHVIRLLDGKANVTKLGSVPSYRIDKEPKPKGYLNFGNTVLCMADFDSFARHLKETKYDVIHFNFGLNDIFRGRKGAWHAPPARYAANLDRIVTMLKANGAKVIWANTTPVPANAPHMPAGDDLIYNAAAKKVMDKHNIAINDLHGVVTSWDGYAEWKTGDNVHFSGAVYRKLAEQVAERIAKQFGTPGEAAE